MSDYRMRLVRWDDDRQGYREGYIWHTWPGLSRMTGGERYFWTSGVGFHIVRAWWETLLFFLRVR